MTITAVPKRQPVRHHIPKQSAIPSFTTSPVPSNKTFSPRKQRKSMSPTKLNSTETKHEDEENSPAPKVRSMAPRQLSGTTKNLVRSMTLSRNADSLLVTPPENEAPLEISDGNRQTDIGSFLSVEEKLVFDKYTKCS